MNLEMTLWFGGMGSGCQGPNCGRKPEFNKYSGPNVFFHGTTIEKVDSIRKRGLRIGQRKNFYKGSKSKAIFLTTNRDQARYFGHKVASAKRGSKGYAIVKLEIPEELHKGFDPDGRVNDSWKARQDIPKKFVKDIEVRKWRSW